MASPEAYRHIVIVPCKAPGDSTSASPGPAALNAADDKPHYESPEGHESEPLIPGSHTPVLSERHDYRRHGQRTEAPAKNNVPIALSRSRLVG